MESKIRAEANKWIAENPAVFDIFYQLAMQRVEKQQRFGINALREVVRWNYSYTYNSEFKFCNTYSPYVARALIAKNPSIAAFMRCKRTKDEIAAGFEVDDNSEE